jgi:hypothetical protein
LTDFTAGVTTSAGSTTLPLCALVGSAATPIRLKWVAVYNTTATACTLVLCRLSTAGTPGTAAVSRVLNGSDTATAVAALRNTYTSTAPTTTELAIRFPLPAAVAGGLIRPFNDWELTIPATANAAIGLLVLSGTGQAVETDWGWRE